MHRPCRPGATTSDLRNATVSRGVPMSVAATGGYRGSLRDSWEICEFPLHGCTASMPRSAVARRSAYASSGSGPGHPPMMTSPSMVMGTRTSDFPHGGPAMHSPVSGT